ncbi:ATP12 family protein [uncultured Cohaesibacter sp.]|uniref:ATP12 family chaperone protein n=1 Tax=uncultured Cohaesibacter sp. TaxID=1002546 RepID=UPI00292CE741|nr:ATP12 family protein [uncultured Cohaesibacter sp.]
MSDKNDQKHDSVEFEQLFGDFVPGQKDSSQNPMMRSKEAAKTPLPKRFYKQVEIGCERLEDGSERFSILLDGRSVRSPAKKIVAVPSRSVAEILREEWDAQQTEINPALMPMTRLVNSTIDGVEAAREAMLEEICAYLGNDLLCYPASHPQRLVERQKAHWHPVLDWAEVELGGRFVQASGILAVDQSPVMAERLKGIWCELDIFQLASVHTIMTITGSALLSYALWKRFMERDEVWAAAMVDEDWNIELWGEDEEATKRRVFRRTEFDAAAFIIEAFQA